jgi:hypothetical protein
MSLNNKARKHVTSMIAAAMAAYVAKRRTN